jgi:exonuclease III
MTFAIVKTKSNYENLNGKRLKVVENNQNFITCEFMREGKIVRADFGKSEVVQIYTPVNLNLFIGR